MSAQRLSEQLPKDGWERRLRDDRRRAERLQTPEQRAVTAVLLDRAMASGAAGFALTGSTARKRRTAVSDLDYHVVGSRPDAGDLPGDVDVVATGVACLRDRLLEGDDFVQWTLRFGCILHDTGALHDGLRLIVERDLWPSPQRKLETLGAHTREVRRLIEMGDRDAAQEQLRATLTTAARGLLLQRQVFPLARSELSAQLLQVGYRPLAEVLGRTIRGRPHLDELGAGLQVLDQTLQTLHMPMAA
jgi:hypothetical protein